MVTTVFQILLWALLAYLIYVIGFMVWVETQKRGDRYFARPLAEREQFIALLKRHALVIRPLFEAIANVIQLKRMPTIRYQGVTGPAIMCSKKSYAATQQYQPRPEDIFIATQMKCGTTWMQQIVFEILHGGEGDLSDTGYHHLYAMSPWIETSPTSSVSMENALLVGKRQNRLIKTHMPAQFIQQTAVAKYIYVTRHPVSCFASCVDFIRLLGGPLVPKRKDLLDWYCSDDMWWMSWPDHVEGWWQRSQQHSNVLFVHYEELKRDLPGMTRKIARFLEVDLTDQALQKVVNRSSFEYMRAHENHFEMLSPNVFSVSNRDIRFMQSGALDRHKDTQADERERICAFTRSKLAKASYPLDQYYPDVLQTPPKAG